MATPATAATLAVPSSTPPGGGFVPIATVVVPVKPVAVLPAASRAVTWIAGANGAPAAASPGWTVNASWVAAPEVMLKAWLPAGMQGFEKLQEMFLGQMGGRPGKK